MKKIILLLIYCSAIIATNNASGQKRQLGDFYGNAQTNASVLGSNSFEGQSDVKLLVEEIKKRLQIPMPILVQRSEAVDNCQARYVGLQPCILYNETFMQGTKGLNFSQATLPRTNWVAIGVLCHELGHLIQFHQSRLDNDPDVRLHDLELEADKYAGSALYRLGASLDEAKRCMSNSPENAGISHPARYRRLAAIEEGYKEAEANNPRNTPANNTTTETYTENALGLGLVMHRIRGGTFTMGSDDGDTDEKPPHEVTVSDFYMGVYEVTQAQWWSVISSNNRPIDYNCDNCPIERVQWDTVQKFLRKLNQQTGKVYRLPTEAEWEYAARGGANSRGYKYAGSNDIDAVAWYSGNYDSSESEYGIHPRPVGTKKANELGLYDMTGNVREWCSDWYDANYYINSPRSNPQGASSGANRVVIRGGGYYSDSQNCRVADRYSGEPDDWTGDLGFRLVISY